MDLEQQLQELKYEYVRMQGDLEKMESTGNNPDKMIQKLESLENEIKDVKNKIKNNESS